MTPKEKAQELFDKCYEATISKWPSVKSEQASTFANICVDEILKLQWFEGSIVYWNEVKQEIEKL